MGAIYFTQDSVATKSSLGGMRLLYCVRLLQDSPALQLAAIYSCTVNGTSQSFSSDSCNPRQIRQYGKYLNFEKGTRLERDRIRIAWKPVGLEERNSCRQLPTESEQPQNYFEHNVHQQIILLGRTDRAAAGLCQFTYP